MDGHNRMRLQNQLYRLLLDKKERRTPDLFLKRLLALFVKVTGARQGYLELRGNRSRTFWTASSFSPKETRQIHRTVSRGIIAAALEDLEPVITVSAIHDPRFSSRRSVKSASIEAVLCVPIRSGQVFGVLYLQGAQEFKVDQEVREAKMIVEHIGPLVNIMYGESLKRTPEAHMADLRAQYDVGDVIGSSNTFSKTLALALALAPLEISVLLTGETGTGKTQLAHILHKNSARKKEPFVPLNCAALPESLLENELFGAVKGGHSSAFSTVQGKVSAAHKGTLFLDEIAELPLAVQAKLLQLIESGLYYPLGSAVPEKADIRILSATNVDLKKKIRQKKFREDLYYRINIFTIRMPSLRERGQDVHDLARWFCKKTCSRNKIPHLPLSKEACDRLTQKTFRGNIRELKNLIEAAAVVATIKGDPEILPGHFLDDAAVAESSFFGGETNFKAATQMFQQRFLLTHLENRNWNISQTARELYISRSQLNHLISKYDLRKVGQDRDTSPTMGPEPPLTDPLSETAGPSMIPGIPYL